MKRITANQYQTSERYYKLPKILFEDEEEWNTQPILKRKVEKVTKYDRDYIWGLVQDQFRREGFSETASEIAMTDFERIYQYALDKNRDNLRLMDFVEMILKNPELTIRLPLAVSNKRVYPNLNLEEARALLPRNTKQLIYMEQTHYLSS
jgi:hypothetical protein